MAVENMFPQGLTGFSLAFIIYLMSHTQEKAKEVKNMAKKNTSKKPPTDKVVTLSAVVAKASELSGKEAEKCGKEIRGRIRRNFDDLAKSWPQLEAKDNRDGNRYPAMPVAVAQTLLEPYRK